MEITEALGTAKHMNVLMNVLVIAMDIAPASSTQELGLVHDKCLTRGMVCLQPREIAHQLMGTIYVKYCKNRHNNAQWIVAV